MGLNHKLNKALKEQQIKEISEKLAHDVVENYMKERNKPWNKVKRWFKKLIKF